MGQKEKAQGQEVLFNAMTEQYLRLSQIGRLRALAPIAEFLAIEALEQKIDNLVEFDSLVGAHMLYKQKTTHDSGQVSEVKEVFKKASLFLMEQNDKTKDKLKIAIDGYNFLASFSIIFEGEEADQLSRNCFPKLLKKLEFILSDTDLEIQLFNSICFAMYHAEKLETATGSKPELIAIGME